MLKTSRKLEVGDMFIHRNVISVCLHIEYNADISFTATIWYVSRMLDQQESTIFSTTMLGPQLNSYWTAGDVVYHPNEKNA